MSDTIPSGADGGTAPALPANVSGITITGYFFYGDGCVHCDSVKPVLASLSTKYPDLDIQSLEIYHNATNQALYSAMLQQNGVVNPGVPVLFIGKRVLIGDVNIKNYLEEAFLTERQLAVSCGNATPVPITPPGVPCPQTPALTPALVIGSALIDSVNPCAFSVLIFLLVSVVSLRNRRRVLAVGGCYIAAVFCFYLLSGLGLLSLVRISGVSTLLSYLGAGVAIILGIVSIVDVLRNKDAFVLAIPASRKEQIDRYILRSTLPAAFVLGILVGIFELPCTGGIYLAILGLVSTNYTLMEGLPYLILYNIIFVLPLIVILLLVAFGLDPERADAWRIRHRRVLRLIVGVAMIVLGVVIFLGIFG